MPRFFSLDHERPTDPGTLQRGTKDALAEEADLPPVVARMVVEIRSDGTRTVARGALEDLVSGEKVALQANAQSPVALARELTKVLVKSPILAGDLAKQAVRQLLPEAIRQKTFSMNPLRRKKKDE